MYLDQTTECFTKEKQGHIRSKEIEQKENELKNKPKFVKISRTSVTCLKTYLVPIMHIFFKVL